MHKTQHPSGTGVEPIVVSVAQARELLGGLGTTTIYSLMKTGELRSTSVGGRRLIYVASIRKLLGVTEKDAA